MKNKGISLIVLIITIIVIIILAGAVVLSLASNNPINEATEATFKEDMQSYQAELTLWLSKEYVAKQGNLNIETVNATSLVSTYPTTMNILDIIPMMKQQHVANLFIIKGVLYYNLNGDETEKEWAKECGIGSSAAPNEPGEPEIPEQPTGPVKEYVDTVPIPNGFTASIIGGENTKAGGLVISDVFNNQFVWVPVEFVTDEAFDAGFKILDFGIIGSNTPGTEPFTSGYPNEVQEYNQMKESVKKYKGFYIARYEGSKYNAQAKVASQKGNAPWKLLWGASPSSLGTSGAVYYCNKMAADYGYTSVVSTLTYGVQWDRAINFIRIKDPTYHLYAQGNRSGTVIHTGSNANYNANNIFDLAANVWEWTMEYLASGGNRVARGGSASLASDYTVATRTTVAGPHGFRPSLYLKLD